MERLQIGTRRRLAGGLGGEHRSPRHGESVDYADHRRYHQGDDYRRIDYNLYARLDVLMIKLFEAEDDLTLRLLVDTSASMGVAGKLHQARRVAAALGFVGLLRRDPVIVHTFAGETQPRRFVGRSATWDLFDHLSGLRAAGPTAFAAAATDLLARPGPAGLTVVISDLLTPDWAENLTRLSTRRGDVVVVHVLSSEDLRPTLFGDLDLVDVETGRSLAVSLTADVLAGYEREARRWVDEVAARCHRAGVVVLPIMADDDLERVLLARWRASGALR